MTLDLTAIRNRVRVFKSLALAQQGSNQFWYGCSSKDFHNILIQGIASTGSDGKATHIDETLHGAWVSAHNTIKHHGGSVLLVAVKATNNLLGLSQRDLRDVYTAFAKLTGGKNESNIIRLYLGKSLPESGLADQGTKKQYDKLWTVPLLTAININPDFVGGRRDGRELLALLDNMFLALCRLELARMTPQNGYTFKTGKETLEHTIASDHRLAALPAKKKSKVQKILTEASEEKAFDVLALRYLTKMQRAKRGSAHHELAPAAHIGLRGRSRITAIIKVDHSKQENVWKMVLQMGKVPSTFMSNFRKDIDKQSTVLWFDTQGNRIGVNGKLDSSRYEVVAYDLDSATLPFDAVTIDDEGAPGAYQDVQDILDGLLVDRDLKKMANKKVKPKAPKRNIGEPADSESGETEDGEDEPAEEE